jgi:hypothetical protein
MHRRLEGPAGDPSMNIETGKVQSWGCTSRASDAPSGGWKIFLQRAKAFKLPGKKRLQPADHQIEFIVVDVAETPVERPKKKQQDYYSGKKKRDTLKSQVVINGANRQVICTAHGRGPTHDFALYKRSKVEPHESLELLADSGYQVLSKLHEKRRTPQKKLRKAKLADEQKQGNRELARRRVVAEHVIRSLKIFRILAERYRNQRMRFSLWFNLIAGLYNYELGRG